MCEGLFINGDYHLIENNDISHVSDGITTFGTHNVYRNNTMHDTNVTDCGSNSSNCHIDFIESEPVTSGGLSRPSQYNVYEGNTLRNNLGANGHAFLTQGDACGGQCFNVIIRFNNSAHVGSYDLLDNLGGYFNVKSYNNDILDFRVPNWDTADGFAGASTGGAEFNNLFYWPGSATLTPYSVLSDSLMGFTAGSNLADCGGTCSFFSRTQSGSFAADAPGNLVANPLFANYSGDDFHLQSGSPAIGHGASLTAVASGDAGAGT